MISVVIPLYNAGGTVERTLRSVLAQTFTDFEIVVVDDGSTDDGAAKVLSMEIPNLQLIRQENAGVSAARNRGIAEARGEFVALLDSDDEWHPEYLQTQFEMTRKYPECDVFATNYEFRDVHCKTSSTIIRGVKFEANEGIMDNYFEVASQSHPPMWTSAVMVSKQAYIAVGGFPVGIKSGEDLLTWARLALRYRIAYSKRVLAYYNRPAIMTSNLPAERLGGELYVLDELRGMLAANPDVVGLRDYVFRFTKIYGVLLIEAVHGHRAFGVSVKALFKGGKMKDFLPIMVFSLLPQKFARRLFLRLRR